MRVRFLNAVAVRGLALFDDPAIGHTLARITGSSIPRNGPSLLETLASRPAFARALLDQVAAGRIPRQELTAVPRPADPQPGRPGADRPARAGLGRAARLGRRPPRADRGAQGAARLRPHSPRPIAATAGRSSTASAPRATALGYGGEIGPDLTGSGRDNLDYLLENIVDPSASVSADFRMVVVAMNDGRVLNGLVRARTDRTLTLQTQTEILVLDRREIDSEKVSVALAHARWTFGSDERDRHSRLARLPDEPDTGSIVGTER